MKPRQSLPLVESCDDCGVCCMEQAGLPINWYLGCVAMEPSSKLPPSLLAEMKATLAEWQAGHFLDDGAPCVWYDHQTKRCKHYEHRPELCRTAVVVGNEACHRWRRKYDKESKGVRRIVNGKVVKV